MARSPKPGQICVALTVIALGAILAFEATGIAVSPGYARIGPRVFPFVVAVGLIGLGGVLLVQALTARWGAEPPADHRLEPLLAIWSGIAGYALLIAPAGFVIASTLLFVAVARAFQSQRLLRDTGIGFALSLAAFAFFTQALQLALPMGWIFSRFTGAA
jgi:putative tricarboxylic transport membrane protein